MRALILSCLVAAACGKADVGTGGKDVGAPCTSNAGCSGMCLLGNDNFPNGLCTYTCASDMECPTGSVCIDPGQGMGTLCAVSCKQASDCANYGAGFACATLPDADPTIVDPYVCRFSPTP